jgi:hypothetical protein
MIDMATPGSKTTQIAAQPITLAASALIVIVLGTGAIALWRAHAGTVPEQDRLLATRQAWSAQAFDQLLAKTKALEATQQESIDQLQMAQDQLQTVRRLLAAQQADTKRLSEQVSGLTEAIDSLRQSFASAQGSEASASSTRKQSARTTSQSRSSGDRKRSNSRS